jgi:hypothetical protein
MSRETLSGLALWVRVSRVINPHDGAPCGLSGLYPFCKVSQGCAGALKNDAGGMTP